MEVELLDSVFSVSSVFLKCICSVIFNSSISSPMGSLFSFTARISEEDVSFDVDELKRICSSAMEGIGSCSFSSQSVSVLLELLDDPRRARLQEKLNFKLYKTVIK